MKRFYKFLMSMVAIVAMALPLSVAAQTCSIKVVGQDGYADGWNGGSLAVMQGTTTVGTFNAANADNDGEGPERDSATFSVQSSMPVTFVWTSGTYDDEVTIWIYDGNGTMVYTVTEPDAGTIYTMSSPCSSCIVPQSLTTAVTDSDVEIGWASGTGTAWDIVWGTGSFNPDTVTVNVGSSTTNSYTINNLSDGLYTAYVRTDCGTENNSWSSVHFGIGGCIIRIVGTDGFGDGWDGGYLTIRQSGSTLQTFALAEDDATGSINLYVADSAVSFVWSAGDYDDEITISIYDGSGVMVYTVSGLSAGTIFTMNDPCPSCMAIDSLAADSITTETVHVSWNAGTGTEWLVYINDSLVDNATTAAYNFTGLTPNTVYSIGIRNLCGTDDTSSLVSINVRTACAPISTLPYAVDFEACETGNSVVFDPCWSIGNTYNTYYNYPYVYNNNGSKYLSMYMYGDNGASQHHGYAMLPELDEELLATNMELSFDVWAFNDATYGKGVIVAIFDSNAYDANSSFDTVALIMPQATSYATRETKYVSLANRNLEGKRIGFFYKNLSTTATGYYYYTYIDNVSLHEAPSCLTPSNLTLDNVTPDTLALSWNGNDASSFYVEYRKSGDSTWTGAEVSDSAAVLEPLDANTVYEVQVRALCGSDTSFAIGGSFRTACAPISTLPFVVDFETCATGSSAVFDPCWSIGNTYSATTNYPYVYNGAGNRYLYMYMYGSSGASQYHGYAMLPELDEELLDTEMELSFDIWGSGTANYGKGVIVAIFDSNAYDANSTFDTVAIIVPEAISYTTRETKYVSLVNRNLEGKRIGFFFKNQVATATGYAFQTYIDNVNLHEAPSCLVPSNLTLDTVTPDTLALSWTGNGASSFYVEYRKSGNSAWTGVEVADSAVVLEPLDANTMYEVQVRTLCGGDTSFALIGSFRTACGPIATLPWEEDFNAMSVTTGATVIPCWDYIGAGGYVNIQSGSYVHSGNAVRFYPNGSNTTDHILLLPEFDTATSALEMTLWTRPEGSASGSLSVGYVTNATQASSFVEMFNVPASVGTTYAQYTVTFAGAPDDARIALRHNINSTAWYWFVDDINVHAAPSCLPTSIPHLALVDTSAATIAWSGNASQYEYVITNAAGVVLDSNIINDDEVAFANYSLDSTYTIKVRAICSDEDTSTWKEASILIGYCIPNATSVDGIGITNVTFGTGSEVVNNNATITSAPYYGNFASQIGAVPSAGDDVTVTMTYATSYTYGTIIWVDWNNNISFDGNEVVYVGVSSSANPTTLTATFTVPDYVQPGYYRMRIAGADSYFDNYTGSLDAAANANPCFSSSYSVAHDYTLHVLSASSCPRPTDLVFDTIGTDTVTFHWTADISQNAWLVTVGNNAPVTVQTASFSMGGLSASTTYDVAIRALCGVGDTSSTLVGGFATACGAAELPVTYGFEEYTTLQAINCWTRSDSTLYASSTLTGYAPSAWQNSEYAHSSDKSLLFFPTSAVANTIATPEMNHAGNDLQVSFWTKGYMYNTAGTFEAGVMTDPTDTATFVSLFTLDSNTADVREYTFTTASLTSTAHVSIAFRATTDSSYAYLTIDDVFIEAIPSCNRPSELAVDNATLNSITVSWPAVTGAQGYQVAYIHGTDTTYMQGNVTGTTATVTGLDHSTTYTLMVRTVCSTSDLSAWRTVSTSTACDAVTVFPYEEGFENGLDCWTAIDPDNGTNGWRSGMVTNVDPHGGNNYAVSFSWNGNAYHADEWLLSPQFALPQVDTVTLGWWFRVNTGYYEDNYAVLVSTTGTDTASFTQLIDIHPTSANGDWTYQELDLSQYAGQSIYIAFHHHDSYDANYIAIDDISITATGNVQEGYYMVSARSADASMGTASVDPSGSVAEGTSVTFTATPAEGFSFVNWTDVAGTAVSTSNPYTTTVTDNLTLIANFEALPCLMPTDVIISGLTLDGGVIEWTPGEAGQSNFEVRVYNSTYDSTFAVIGTSLTVSGLYASVDYSVVVRAVCGENSYSDWTTAITLTPSECARPTDVTATAAGRVVTVSWQSSGAERYRVTYFDEFSAIADATTVDVEGTSTTVTVPEGGMNYSFYVQAYCSGALSTYSDPATVSIVGINVAEGSNISLYPNPASTTVTVEGIEGQATVTMVDLNGRETGKWSVNGGAMTINVNGLAKGTYFVRIVSEKSTAVRKLVVR